MALNGINIYLANSKYTYKTIDNIQACGWFADIYDIQVKKENIMFEMIDQINYWNNGLISKEWLIAIFDKHKSNNEDYKYFNIFEYKDGYSDNDYIENLKSFWFWFIENRVV